MELNLEICNFVDDMFSCQTLCIQVALIYDRFRSDVCTVLNWFYANCMLENPDMFQLMFLELNEKHRLSLNIQDVKIPSTEHVKLLGIEIDNQL